jgi:hypothetical protein
MQPLRFVKAVLEILVKLIFFLENVSIIANAGEDTQTVFSV